MGAFPRSLVVRGEAGGPLQVSGVHLGPPRHCVGGGALHRSGQHILFDSVFKWLFILMYSQIC